MVVRHLEAGYEQFRHYKKYEKLLGPEVPYFSGIGAVMYIVNNTIKTRYIFCCNLICKI